MAECALEDARQEGYARYSSSSSSSSSSSTSMSAEHSGQRITAPSSLELFAKWRYEAVPHRCAAYYIPWNMKSTPERGAAAWNSTAPYLQGPPAWLLPESTPKDPLSE